MEAKAKEFNEVLQEQYCPWFAQYMVMKRASIRPNFHDLYLKFFDKVNSRSLNKEIMKATYMNRIVTYYPMYQMLALCELLEFPFYTKFQLFVRYWEF